MSNLVFQFSDGSTSSGNFDIVNGSWLVRHISTNSNLPANLFPAQKSIAANDVGTIPALKIEVSSTKAPNAVSSATFNVTVKADPSVKFVFNPITYTRSISTPTQEYRLYSPASYDPTNTRLFTAININSTDYAITNDYVAMDYSDGTTTHGNPMMLKSSCTSNNSWLAYVYSPDGQSMFDITIPTTCSFDTGQTYLYSAITFPNLSSKARGDTAGANTNISGITIKVVP